MKIVTAPEQYFPDNKDVLCFLAGGINKCKDWQQKVIETLKKYEHEDPYSFRHTPDNLVILNPRRENFPIDNPDAAKEQIVWESNWLNKCDIFSMYFCEGESDQPICMYELGRYLHKFSAYNDIEDHMVISVEQGYKRYKDVVIQTQLATHNAGLILYQYEVSPEAHADHIISCYDAIIEKRIKKKKEKLFNHRNFIKR